jgi:hypothetical protein
MALALAKLPLSIAISAGGCGPRLDEIAAQYRHIRWRMWQGEGTLLLRLRLTIDFFTRSNA